MLGVWLYSVPMIMIENKERFDSVCRVCDFRDVPAPPAFPFIVKFRNVRVSENAHVCSAQDKARVVFDNVFDGFIQIPHDADAAAFFRKTVENFYK